VAGAERLQPKHLDPDTLDIEELKQRFLVVQAVEAARTVEDHVITDMREADVGSILGFGFAPFTGGTLSYIDFMGRRNSSSCATSSRPNTARASPRRNCWRKWPPRARPSTAASRRRTRRGVTQRRHCEERRHSGMVRRTRPGSSRFRVRCCACPGMTAHKKGRIVDPALVLSRSENLTPPSSGLPWSGLAAPSGGRRRGLCRLSGSSGPRGRTSCRRPSAAS